MKQTSSKTFSLSITLALIILFAAASFAQESPDISHPVKISTETQVNPASIKVKQRRQLAFKPFEMIDPSTGAPTSPETVFTLPDGKHVRAGEYYEKLNEIERGLNALGYSLREDWETITIQESVIDKTALDSRVGRIRASVNQNKPFRVRSFDEFNREALKPQPELSAAVDGIKIFKPPVNLPTPGTVEARPTNRIGGINPNIGNIIIAPAKKPVVDSVKDYPYSIGDPNLFAAYVDGKLGLKGGEEKMQLAGEAKAGCSMFGKSADIIKLTGNMTAPRTGNMSGNVALSVLPFGTVYNLSLEGASVSKEDGASKTLDVQFANFIVTIGPVPVRVKAGAQGSVGFKYYAGLNPTSAVAEFTPMVHSKVYVQAGIDVVVAGAGAGAEMTLVNYDLSLYGGVRLWAQTPEGQTKPMLGIREQFQIAQKLQMLSGSAYAYAYIYVPRIGLPPWKKKEWRWDIWNWDGFTPLEGYLVDEEHWTSLGIPAK